MGMAADATVPIGRILSSPKTLDASLGRAGTFERRAALEKRMRGCHFRVHVQKC